MQYWLMKSEPSAYSWDDLVAEKKAMWDGVRNYAARNNMRMMEKGDRVLFYHSVKDPQVVGLAEVVRTHYPDPTADKGDWSVVDIAPLKPFNEPVHLKQIKAEPSLSEMALVKISRLSVSPVRPAEFEKILEMGETKV